MQNNIKKYGCRKDDADSRNAVGGFLRLWLNQIFEEELPSSTTMTESLNLDHFHVLQCMSKH